MSKTIDLYSFSGKIWSYILRSVTVLINEVNKDLPCSIESKNEGTKSRKTACKHAIFCCKSKPHDNFYLKIDLKYTVKPTFGIRKCEISCEKRAFLPAPCTTLPAAILDLNHVIILTNQKTDLEKKTLCILRPVSGGAWTRVITMFKVKVRNYEI